MPRGLLGVASFPLQSAGQQNSPAELLVSVEAYPEATALPWLAIGSCWRSGRTRCACEWCCDFEVFRYSISSVGSPELSLWWGNSQVKGKVVVTLQQMPEELTTRRAYQAVK
jgi:hypothetical protein